MINTEKENLIYLNKDYDLVQLVDKLAMDYNNQRYSEGKTKVGLTKEVCEQVNALVAYVKENY